MLIRYGFDLALELTQPTTILAMMDVHSEFRRSLVEETELTNFHPQCRPNVLSTATATS